MDGGPRTAGQTVNEWGTNERMWTVDGGPRTAGQTVNEWGTNERMWTADRRRRMAEDGLSRRAEKGGQLLSRSSKIRGDCSAQDQDVVHLMGGAFFATSQSPGGPSGLLIGDCFAQKRLAM